MHLKDDELRMYFDQELSPKEVKRVEEHLSRCTDCSQRLARLAERSQRVESAFSVLEPGLEEAPQPASAALSRLSQREKEVQKMKPLQKLRPAWVMILAVCALAVSFAFPPVRAAAHELLMLFRVEQVETFPLETLNLETLSTDPTLAETISELFSESVSVLEGDPEAIEVIAALEEADRLTNFDVRLPEDDSLQEIRVQKGFTFEIQVDAERARQVLEQVGKDDLILPDELDNASIQVAIPDRIMAMYGNCQEPDAEQGVSAGKDECIVYIQSPSPVVSSPPDLDPAVLAEIGLQVLGVSPQEAKAFSQSSDWMTTLVIPIPRGDVAHREVMVDGVQGSFFTHLYINDEEMKEVHSYTLLWLKDGLIHAVTGRGDDQQAFDLAESLVP